MSVKLTYLGHSGFLISDGAHTLAVDPFLTGNPKAVHTVDQIECDTIALTHGHADHFGDTVQLAQNNGAKVIAAFEVCNYCQEQGIENVDPGNPGGHVHTDFGYVAFVPAFHSSSYEGRYMGQPCGLVIEMGGVVLYHTGDTALYSDMKLVGELAKPEVMMVCCGDRFTMGPELARIACEYVQPKVAIPIHYGTWPLLTDDLSEFTPHGIEVRQLQPGETWSYGG